jgi:membrane dipeptidase
MEGTMRTAQADEDRSTRLHRDSLVVDSCSQFGPNVYTPEMLARIDELADAGAPSWQIVVDIEAMVHQALLRDGLPGFWEGWNRAGVDILSFTIGAFGKELFTYENAIRDLAMWTQVFDLLGDRLVKVLAAEDMRRAKADGRRGIILAFQNATHIGADLGKLDEFHQLGMRIIQLTYNSRNLLGDGCTERVKTGLSQFGVAVVERMNELGILVDVSHCSDATALDAIEASARPVAITHAFCSSINIHDRGKADEVLRAIGERDGYFGVCVVPFFITEDPSPSLAHWLEHVDRAVELAGAEHVGIGTDWGEVLPPRLRGVLDEEVRRLGFREEHRVDWAATLDGYRSWSDWPNLTQALVENGYSDLEVRGFLGGNFLRVFERAVG